MDSHHESRVLEMPLISASRRNGNYKSLFGHNRDEVLEEAKKQVFLAAPLMSVNVLLSLIQVISVMFVGHFGELALSAASMATSFASVTGFSFLIGMACTLDTFCGQSYGAKQYHMLGIHTQRAIVVLLLVSIPVACIWASAGHILVFFGQDPEISAEAGVYARFMLPTVFSIAILQCQFRFLQAQNIVVPMMFCAGITTLLHILICWILVCKTSLETKGAAVANGISYWIYNLLLALYIKLSPSCKNTWTGFSNEAFHDVGKFLRLAVPSALMICVEIWSFEMMVLLAGLLPDPKLETSVLSISLNTNTMFYMIPLGLGGAISVRVSNELGAGRPQAARLAVAVAIFLVAAESIMVVMGMIFWRKVWGNCYSKEEEVVEYVSEMMLLIAAMHLPDGIQSVLSGIARGCGWQKICAVVNLGAYYLLGIPFGILLAFVYHVGGKGLWAGVMVAVFAQTLFLFIITVCTDWEKEAKKASVRVSDSTIPVKASNLSLK